MRSLRHEGVGSQTIKWITDNLGQIEIPVIDAPPAASRAAESQVMIDGRLVSLGSNVQRSAFVGSMIDLKATDNFRTTLPDIAGDANSSRNLFMMANVPGDGNCYMNAVLASVILSNANNKQEIITFLDGLKIIMAAERNLPRMDQLLGVQTSEPSLSGVSLNYSELVTKFNQEIERFQQQISDSPISDRENPNAIHPQTLYDIINQRGQYATQSAGNQLSYSRERGLSKIASLFAKISAHQIEKMAGGWYEENQAGFAMTEGEVGEEFSRDIEKMKKGEFKDLGNAATSFFSNIIEKKTRYKLAVLSETNGQAQLNDEQINDPKAIFILHKERHYTAAIKKNSGIREFLPQKLLGIDGEIDPLSLLSPRRKEPDPTFAPPLSPRSLRDLTSDDELSMSSSGFSPRMSSQSDLDGDLRAINSSGPIPIRRFPNSPQIGTPNQAPEPSYKKIALAAAQSFSAMPGGLLQGIVHFPKVEEDSRHKKFLGKLEGILQSHPNLQDSGIDKLFDALKTHIAEETKDDPNKGQGLLQKFEEMKQKIEAQEEERRKKLKEATKDFVQQSEKITEQDIDGQNSMWKWRLAQIILLTCGLCGVDVLEPALDLFDHIFSPDATSFGQGAYEGMSQQVPGAGHVAGGITMASDHIPIIGDFNNLVYALGSSELGQAVGGILGPLAHTQLASILFAAGFLADGVFNHQIPHDEKIRAARGALKEKLRNDPFAELDEEARGAYKSACDEFARQLILNAYKTDIAMDHVVQMMNKDKDLLNNLHIFKGIDFMVGGKKSKIEELDENSKRDLLALITKTDDIKKLLPRDEHSLNEIMVRLALHNELKSDKIADLSNESPIYQTGNSDVKKQIFSEVLQGVRANQPKYLKLCQKLREETDGQKVEIDKAIIRKLQKECCVIDSEKKLWIRKENERRAKLQDKKAAAAMNEQEELSFIKSKLEAKYVEKIASELAKSRNSGASYVAAGGGTPFPNPTPPITATQATGGLTQGQAPTARVIG